jgi:hypothetical protein
MAPVPFLTVIVPACDGLRKAPAGLAPSVLPLKGPAAGSSSCFEANCLVTIEKPEAVPPWLRGSTLVFGSLTIANRTSTCRNSWAAVCVERLHARKGSEPVKHAQQRGFAEADSRIQ